MTEISHKNGVSPMPETAKSKRMSKTRKSTSNFTKHWKFIWQSYACEEQDGRAVPMDTKGTYFSLKPSPSEINQLRKMAHAKGFKLVSIQPCCPYPEDEF